MARRVVSLGGLTIIGSIFAILVVIVAQVVPLFLPPSAADLGSFLLPAAGRPLAAGVDEYREIAYLIDDRGMARFVSLAGGEAPEPVPLLPAGAGPPVAAASAGGGHYAVSTSDGLLLPLEVRFDVTYQDGSRSSVPRVVAGEPLVLDPVAGRSGRRLAYARLEDGALLAAQVAASQLVVVRITERRSLIGGATRAIDRRTLDIVPASDISVLRLDDRGGDLFVGTDDGKVVRFNLAETERVRPAGSLDAASRTGAAITTLDFLLGDRTLVVGDEAGGVSSWQLVGAKGALAGQLERMHSFAPHRGAVTAFARSSRGKGFLTADAGGTVRLHHGTTGKTLLSLATGVGSLSRVVLAPKGDGLVAAGDNGDLAHWSIDNPHPEISLQALFAPIWYEGYDRPETVWQSTGGTDDFEPKLSLTPLIYGTLKGTFYALLFAIPLALVSALYTSQFMHPAIKGIVKPAVEIMAALPSVVLGFIAGLWLAPVVETVVPGMFLMILILPAIILIAMAAWQRAPAALTRRLPVGAEVFLLIPVVTLGVWISIQLGGVLEGWFLHGDYRSFILQAFGLAYDQRNSLVVGIAMGFAVIPIIYTIAEDSLSNVPKHLTAASLALGATRWQTALKVVLPTASPGIFSAIMIGFGRAVGETMIVLMATGNTPVMDWSIFNGFRALSANIAVELPEAPAGGTLFRVLFLAALLLFAMTFVVNTAAEVVRLKLRARYRYL